MDRTRRSLCGLGIAGVPLAVLAPTLLSAAQEPVAAADPFLAYLVAETRRNCLGATHAGRNRTSYIRAVGANVETLSCYLHSRPGLREMEARIKSRLREEGVDALALQARDNWTRVASDLVRDYGIVPPADLDHATLTTALHTYERWGLPNFHAVRRHLERQADAIDLLEGRNSAAVATQTPGNDYGPAGWNAGIGDPGTPSCYQMGVLLALLGVLDCFGELSAIVRPIMAAVGLALALACVPLNA